MGREDTQRNDDWKLLKFEERHENKHTRNSINSNWDDHKKPTPRHIRIKLSRVKDKEQSWKQQIRYLVPDNKCANPYKTEAVMPEVRNGLLNPYKQQNQRAFQCRKVQSVPLIVQLILEQAFCQPWLSAFINSVLAVRSLKLTEPTSLGDDSHSPCNKLFPFWYHLEALDRKTINRSYNKRWLLSKEFSPTSSLS